MTQTYQEYLLILLEHYTSNFGPQISSYALVMILPETVLLLSLLVIIATLGLLYKTSSAGLLLMRLKSISYYSLLISLSLLCLTFVLIVRDTGLGGSFAFFQNTYVITAYTQTLKIVVILSLLVIYRYLPIFLSSKHVSNAGELPLLLHISLLLAFIIVSSAHFVVLLLALEGFSLVLYILTTIDRSHGGITAAVKYFTFGTLGSLLLLWGVVHYYALFPNLLYGSVSAATEYALIYSFDTLVTSYNFAGTSIILGFLIKLGAAPTHQWVPDVYAGSHLIITAFFATVVKVIIFMLLCYVSLFVQTNLIVSVFAISSLFVGTFVTLRQVEIKRFLAYSSITHVGFLLVGDLSSSYVYLLTYVCSSLLFFSILLSTSLSSKEVVYFADLRLVKKSGLLSTALLVISLASMAGLPPFSGFFGKYLVWNSLLEDIYLFNSPDSYLFLVISVSLTLLTIFYYTRLIVYVYISSDSDTAQGTFISSFSWEQIFLAVVVTFWVFLQPKLMTLIVSVTYSLSLINIPYGSSLISGLATTLFYGTY